MHRPVTVTLKGVRVLEVERIWSARPWLLRRRFMGILSMSGGSPECDRVQVLNAEKALNAMLDLLVAALTNSAKAPGVVCDR